MNVKFLFDDGDTIVEDLTNDMGEFYSKVGTILSECNVPNKVSIECDLGSAEYDVSLRSGTRLIGERKNTIHLTQSKPFGERYLVMVNADHNNYKFYHLTQNSIGGDVKASWGRIGAKPGEMYSEKSCIYKPEMFWLKYFEKLSKGYLDKSDFYLNKEPEKAAAKKSIKKDNDSIDIALNQASVDLYALLLKFAKHTVETTCISSNVTAAMVKESNRLINKMYTLKTVSCFNKYLLELLSICPRKVGQVQSLLARTPDDFARIIAREENLIDAMEALVSKTPINKNTNDNFAAQGIEVYLANDKQKEEVLRHLDSSLHSKVKNIYRVINHEHKKRFDKYLKDNNIKTVKQLWHGSRNENWMTIIQNGLLLRPNAIITGKMFGNGIYFAPKSTKSWNYTSFRGTYWAKGTSDKAFMGLYATAYGKPLDCYSAHSYNDADLRRNNANCVHAHAGSALLNDEIIYYSESAMVLNYIVEFES